MRNLFMKHVVQVMYNLRRDCQNQPHPLRAVNKMLSLDNKGLIDLDFPTMFISYKFVKG